MPDQSLVREENPFEARRDPTVILISLGWLLFSQVTLVDEEGSVFIKWVDKTVSKVKPQELYKIDTEVKNLLFTSLFVCLFLFACFKYLLIFICTQTGFLDNGYASYHSETFNRISCKPIPMKCFVSQQKKFLDSLPASFFREFRSFHSCNYILKLLWHICSHPRKTYRISVLEKLRSRLRASNYLSLFCLTYRHTFMREGDRKWNILWMEERTLKTRRLVKTLSVSFSLSSFALQGRLWKELLKGALSRYFYVALKPKCPGGGGTS